MRRGSQHKKRYFSLTLICIMLVAVIGTFCYQTTKKLSDAERMKEAVPSFAADGYVRSATYFAHAWPINFWNSEDDDLEGDLAQIKEDGFESIILVLPWREFQPSIDPVGYNDYAFAKLDRIMRVAEGQGLFVYARIGYTHDFYEDDGENIIHQFNRLHGDERTQAAWKDYTRKLHEILTSYPAFKGAFLTWEDHYGIMQAGEHADLATRLNYAKTFGFQQWAAKHYALSDYNEKFGTNYSNFDEIPLPVKESTEMEAMYQFFDDWLKGFLAETQKDFPGISLEVRLDRDPYRKDGKWQTYAHTDTFSCEQAPFTATMYGIPMGFENHGERVTADDTIKRTEFILKNLHEHNDGKPVYIEQFIFLDNTPKFSHNAQLQDDEVNPYLERVAPILKAYSRGYGIWTYRDYENNVLYNPGFMLDAKGWNPSGNISFEMENGSRVCWMETGGSLLQHLNANRVNMLKMQPDFQKKTHIAFDVVSVKGMSVVHLKLGNFEKLLDISETGHIDVPVEQLGAADVYDFAIGIDQGCVAIDNVKVYSLITKGGLYHADGSPYPYLQGIHALNEAFARKD